MKPKYSYRTDFASERMKDDLKSDHVKITKSTKEHCEVSKIHVLEDDDTIGANKGIYVSILFDDLDKEEVQRNVSEVLTIQLLELMKEYQVENKKCLLVGLGNRNVVADALGSEVIAKILVTSHLFELEGEREGVSNVSAIAPGVMGQTGIESFDIIEGICKKVSPDYVIIVDALATKTMSRINKMIQISDTGIAPGSGVGNHRKAINIETLGVPVLVVGVATVVDIISITKEVIENSLKYEKREFDSAYIDELLDELSMDNTSSWIVTPREMDSDLIHLSEVMAHAINSSLHPFLHHS